MWPCLKLKDGVLGTRPFLRCDWPLPVQQQLRVLAAQTIFLPTDKTVHIIVKFQPEMDEDRRAGAVGGGPACPKCVGNGFMICRR